MPCDAPGEDADKGLVDARISIPPEPRGNLEFGCFSHSVGKHDYQNAWILASSLKRIRDTLIVSEKELP